MVPLDLDAEANAVGLDSILLSTTPLLQKYLMAVSYKGRSMYPEIGSVRRPLFSNFVSKLALEVVESI